MRVAYTVGARSAVSKTDSALFFYHFKTQATRLRIDQVTPHQCWNVCDWEATEKDQPSGAQPSLPTCTQRKSGNQSSDCGHHTFEKRHTSSSQPLMLFTRTRWHREGTRHPRSRGTPCLNRIKISKETDSQLQLRRTCHSLPSPSVTQDALRTRTSHVSFRLHAFPGTTCPGLCGSLKLPLPPPTLEGRWRLCRQIHVAR